MIAKCYFCGVKVDRDENICARCGQVICERCDIDSAPEGRHDVHAHRQQPRPGKWDVKKDPTS